MAHQRGGTGAGAAAAVPLPRESVAPLERLLSKGVITARGADRALRVAWTLADLAGLETPGTDQVTTALEFRDRGAA
ncbi:hypothetical protein GS539_24530 [Rhodococcus hoagii]|nr:hypothetical protein [Prescottella equi]